MKKLTEEQLNYYHSVFPKIYDELIIVFTDLVSLTTNLTLSKNSINLINRHMTNSSQLSEKGKCQLCTETNINEPK